MAMIVALAAAIPCLILLTLVVVRRIQSLPFAQTLAVARGGDQRGIALQTIIIMVVLLAIAGSVAAVLLTRAGEETANLNETDSSAYGIENETGCRLGGHEWVTTQATAEQQAAITRAGRAGTFTGANNTGWCRP